MSFFDFSDKNKKINSGFVWDWVISNGTGISVFKNLLTSIIILSLSNAKTGIEKSIPMQTSVKFYYYKNLYGKTKNSYTVH